MVGHYLRKRLRSAWFARRLAGFSLLLLLATVASVRFHVVDFPAFSILLGIVAAIALAALLIALFDLVRVWRRGYAGGGAALAAMLIALLVAAPFALAGVLALRNPPANFAETDGIAEADGTPVSETDAINGRRFAARAPQVYQAVRAVLGDVEWPVSDVETADDGTAPAMQPNGMPPAIGGSVPVPTPRTLPGEEATAEEGRQPDPLDRPESSEYRIAAVALSPILALPSDVEIRIAEDDEEAYLDLRSVSRFGRRDFGQNRRFIEDFLSRIDTAMVGATTPAAAAAGG